MTALLVITILLLLVSVGINVFLGWYAVQAALHLRDISEEISLFWAELIEYKQFLDGLMDMHAYTDDGTVKGFVEATKQVLKEINNFREFCEMSDILTEEEMQIVEEMEEDYEERKENAMKESKGDEHVREWDRSKQQQKQQRPTVPTKTTGIQ